MALQKIIIDTDPGIDDVLAISLALSNPEALEVLLLAITHGNIDVNACTKNLVLLMNVLQQEKEAREQSNLPKLAFQKPIIAIGADKPIIKTHGHGEFEEDDGLEGYHGVDGLNGFHSRNPGLVAEDFLLDFNSDNRPEGNTKAYIPSRLPAYDEILRQLRDNEPKSITIVVLGPCTNLALALAKDPETFHRVSKIIIMGGAVRHAGNMTPAAEFNIYGDPDAAERIFNLSSPSNDRKGYGRVPVALVPLDQTNYHTFSLETLKEFTDPLIASGSPLARLLNDIFSRSFDKIASHSGKALAQCHDPVTIYALLHPELMSWESLDVRVETNGIWTRGQTLIDTRNYPRWKPGEKGIVRDNGNWLHGDTGNQVDVLVGTGDDPSAFGSKLFKGIFRN
ncbi:unnamed protein product [Clonostachys chloroleuca]|uniref:Inosine/uridine-preferring nucleoside hydrolase domain-containing protein n=1 Tax=Clonostachys chloroleuca TaxID=1926264 RepID=A0AA35QCR2_9HYPO|nr:unnamed protein product [Clonostachys chloroleuca]